MPRKGRGGSREGTPGAAYANRTDLNRAPNPATASVVRIPGQAYGEQAKQVTAQQTAPMPGGTPAPVAPRPTGPPPPGAGMADLPPLTGPTTAPDEPLTAGVDFGPGPGSEILGPRVESITAATGNTYADLMRWKPWLPALVQLASQRGTPEPTRAFVRRLRALMPEDR
jgi:hypothetical protein